MSNKIEMLQNPLVTEEGFINEACINELSAAIRNMPETYERLKDDPEWNTKALTSCRDITGALAYWVVHIFACDDYDKNPPAFTPGMENVIGYLHACLRKSFDNFGFAQLSLCDINKLCWDILRDCEQFKAWNTKECLKDSWIDLSALLHNVCITIRNNRRIDAEFNRKFNED